MEEDKNTTEVEAQQQTGNTTQRERLAKRFKEKYPDRDYADDEAIWGQVNEDYDDYDAKLGGYADREKRLTDLLNKDPQSAMFITDMVRGENPFLAMIKRIGIDGMTDLLNDPEKQEEFAEAHKEHLAAVAREKQLEEEYAANLKDSLGVLEQTQQERGLTDEQMDAAYELINKIANDALMGKYTSETLDIALKAINYDADVASASAEGEVKGRNAKIAETLRKPAEGDGQPNLSGANNPPAGQRQMSIFELAKMAKGK